jgi:hypothetical protein
VLPSEIMSGAVTRDSENARRFLAALAASTGETAAASAPPASTPGAQHSAPGSSAPAAPAEGVKTFPMEDPAPGREPR